MSNILLQKMKVKMLGYCLPTDMWYGQRSFPKLSTDLTRWEGDYDKNQNLESKWSVSSSLCNCAPIQVYPIPISRFAKTQIFHSVPIAKITLNCNNIINANRKTKQTMQKKFQKICLCPSSPSSLWMYMNGAMPFDNL